MPAQSRPAHESAAIDETSAATRAYRPAELFPAIAIVAGLTIVGVAAFLLADRRQCRDGGYAGAARLQIDLCDES